MAARKFQQGNSFPWTPARDGGHDEADPGTPLGAFRQLPWRRRGTFSLLPSTLNQSDHAVPRLPIIPTTTTGMVKRPGSAKHPTTHSSSTWQRPTPPTTRRWLIRKPLPTSISPGMCVWRNGLLKSTTRTGRPKVKSPRPQTGSPMALPGTRGPVIEKHCKNCGHCPVSLFIVWNVTKCHRSSHVAIVKKKIKNGPKRPLQPSAVSSGPSNLQKPIWARHHQLDDQYRNTNIKNKIIPLRDSRKKKLVGVPKWDDWAVLPKVHTTWWDAGLQLHLH